MMNKLIAQPIPAPPPRPRMPEHDDEIALAAMLNILYESRWLVLQIALAATLLGIGYAFIAKPVYEASMLIHVEEESRPNESKNILGEMASLFEVKAAAASEIELLRSRLVIARAVERLRLYIDVRPKYFPLIGSWIASHATGPATPGLFGYGGYVWGTETIEVEAFNVPDSLFKHEFVITAQGDGRFQLGDDAHHFKWNGKVGSTLNVKTPFGDVMLRVAQLAAPNGARFLVTRNSELSTIEDVQKAMTIAEQGKPSGIISVTLQGADAQLVNSTLNEIGREYMRQNLSRKTEEAEKSLSFLNRQLPELRQQLEQSEAKYNRYRTAHGTIDLGEEAKISLQQYAAAKAKRLELTQKRTELLVRFTPEHAILVGIDSQIREIDLEIRALLAQIEKLPLVEQEIQNLSREIKVNSDMYTGLLNTAQQLRLISAGKVSNVRLVDASMLPETPVRPNRPMIIAFAAILGLILGVISAFIRKALNGALDGPDQIEKMFGVPVYATIPHSKKLAQLSGQAGTRPEKIPLLAHVCSADVAIESLRTFRTALHIALIECKSNIAMITGATSGLGKTFVSVNLAAITATTGKTVLLIDADLRNGQLHQYFGLARQDGLSELLAGKISLDQSICRDVLPQMDFISTGHLPPNPSELLTRPSLAGLLQALSGQYDLILIDAAPILAISDTLITGAHAGAIFLVARAERTTAGELQESMKRLNQAGLSAKGVLFNDLKLRPGRHDHTYYYPNQSNALRIGA